jgi:alkylation response protein AidB-like acyl-CoA dehydrogenase
MPRHQVSKESRTSPVSDEVTAEFQAFLDERLPAFKQKWGDTTNWDARCAWQRILNEDRWAAPLWPTEYGGRGLLPHEAFRVVELLTEAGFGLLPGVVGLNYIGPTIFNWGTQEQKEQHLSKILDASEIWCQGFSEPEAGSDLASLRTSAVRAGDKFVINGQKIWTSNAMGATHMELLVRTDPSAPKHHGISALIVDMSSSGIERRPIKQIDGGDSFAEVFFTDVEVPVVNLLGSENQGWRVTMSTLGYERAGAASMTRRLAVETAALVQHQHVRDLSPEARSELLRRYIEVKVIEALGEQTLARVAEGHEPGAELSIVKLMYTEACQRIGALRLAFAGKDGISGRDPEAVHSYLNARSLTIAGGTTQVMKNIMAERVLGLPRD